MFSDLLCSFRLLLLLAVLLFRESNVKKSAFEHHIVDIYGVKLLRQLHIPAFKIIAVRLQRTDTDNSVGILL